MKTNHLLLLPLAMSIALLATACNRDASPATPAAETPVAAEPAPAPAEPAPAPAPVATPPATDDGKAFADLDKNSDGGVAMDELAATDMLHQHFTVADSDGDGKLTQAEVDKHRADMAAKPAY